MVSQRYESIHAWMIVASLAFVLAGCAVNPHKPILQPSDVSTQPDATYAIINIHEHMQSAREAKKFLRAMDTSGIAHTVLVGSPKATIFRKGGFKDYDLNNSEMLTIQATYPDRISAFITINPRDKDKLRRLKGYLAAGAKGLKLYHGHSNFHDLPLTDPEMEEIYEYAEKEHLPVNFHVNLGKFLGEFEAVMKNHPQLIVILPHLGLSSIKLKRLELLLDRYPNLYTDLSFGYDPYLIAGLKRISKDPAKFRDFINRYRDRVLYGTDMVVTNHKRKTTEWIAGVVQCYRHMLEREHYRCSLIEDEELNGLALESDILRGIYETNPQRLLGIRTPITN